MRAACPTLLLLWFVALPFSRAHDVDERLDRLAHAIAERPGDVGLLLERARFLRLEDEVARAFSDADAAVRLGGGPLAQGERGLCLERLGHRQRAEEDIDAALAAMPARADWLLARVRLREADGRSNEALRDLERAIQLGADADAWLHRARLVGELRGAQARADLLREALPATREAAPIAHALAQALVEVGSWQELERFASERLLRRGAEELTWRMFRADALAGLGAMQEAKAERLRALAVSRERLASQRTAIALVDGARVLVSLGRWAEARAMLLEALAATPAWAEPSEMLHRLDASAKRKELR